jgi:hypothetical protein
MESDINEAFMLRIIIAILLLLVILVIGLQLWRWSDTRAADAVWAQLADAPPMLPPVFDPASVEELPEPARRFFRFAIAPGTPLSRVAEIEMGGEIGLGDRDAPGYQPMEARQILASPDGFVWRVRAGSGLMRMTGSDGMAGERSWVRFWLLGLVPIVRAGGTDDHRRASFGRVVAEAAFWAPTALLPDNGVTWEEVDADTARATIRRGDLVQTVDVRVDADGRPLSVVIPRWTDANPDRVFRIQPFGGTLDDFREVDGYRLPFSVDGGNFFGTEDYFPFFRARVQAIRMLPQDRRP